jgi:photosystem II PsbU protein
MWRSKQFVNILAILIIICFGLFGWTQLAWGHSFGSATMVAMESQASNPVEERLCSNSAEKIDLNNANTIAFSDCPGFYPTLAKIIVLDNRLTTDINTQSASSFQQITLRIDS